MYVKTSFLRGYFLMFRVCTIYRFKKDSSRLQCICMRYFHVELYLQDDPDSALELENLSTFPRLVITTTPCSTLVIDKACLCTEGGKVVVFGPASTMDTLLLTLHAFYYIMNISYPQTWKDVFIFIDSMLIGVDDAVAKRISLQKFIYTLHK